MTEVRPDEGAVVSTPTLLTVMFDVTGWTAEQVSALAFEASVQAEGNDDHPDADVVETDITGPEPVPAPKRTVVMSLTVTADAEEHSDGEIVDAIEAALNRAEIDAGGRQWLTIDVALLTGNDAERDAALARGRQISQPPPEYFRHTEEAS